ncbi:MAG: hypothetical protein AB9900_01265 [Humidesulfovibrio sp.]
MHSIDDADHFLSTHGPAHGYRLYSTHCSVVDHLAAAGVKCEDVSACIGPEDNLAVLEAHWPGGSLHDERSRLLAALETCVPADFQAGLGLSHPIPLFTALYDYLTVWSLSGKHLFSLALDRILEDFPAAEVLVYDQDAQAPYFTAREILENDLAPRHGFVLAGAKATGCLAARPLPALAVRPRLRTYARALVKRLSGLRRRLAASPAQSAPKTAGRLLLFPEADLKPLLSAALPFELLLWPSLGLPEIPGVDLEPLRARVRPMAQHIATALGAGPPPAVPPVVPPVVPESCWERFRAAFARQGEEFLLSLVLLDTLLRQDLVDAAAWGFSPGSSPQKNLLVHYLLAARVPVAGMQHGGNYGVQDVGCQHLLADYAKCTRFFSYGATRRDIPSRLEEQIPCDIVPVGSTRTPSESLVDSFVPRKGCVVYPPTLVRSTLCAGDMKSPARMAEDQRMLLQALESRTDLEVWIKPLHNATPNTLACPATLLRLKHARIAGGGFTWFLSQMRPQLVVIDFPSSTLFDSLPFDVDIFMLFDPVYRFTPEAERMLSERVHIFETAEEMAKALQLYARAPLKRLRSNEYYARFLHQSGAEERLVEEFAAWSQTWSRRA